MVKPTRYGSKKGLYGNKANKKDQGISIIFVRQPLIKS